MYKLWIGLQPRFVLHIVHGALSIGVLFIHLFAFKAVGYPGSIAQKYPQYFAPVASATR